MDQEISTDQKILVANIKEFTEKFALLPFAASCVDVLGRQPTENEIRDLTRSAHSAFLVGTTNSFVQQGEASEEEGRRTLADFMLRKMGLETQASTEKRARKLLTEFYRRSPQLIPELDKEASHVLKEAERVYPGVEPTKVFPVVFYILLEISQGEIGHAAYRQLQPAQTGASGCLFLAIIGSSTVVVMSEICSRVVFRRDSGGAPLLQNPVDESTAFDQFQQLTVSIQSPPFSFGAERQLEDHAEACPS